MTQNQKPNSSNIRWRIILICINIIVIIGLVSISVPRINSTLDEISGKPKIKAYNSFYYRDNFFTLIAALHQDKSTHKRYDKYWEIAEAYNIYWEYQLFSTASKQLDTNTEDYENKADALSSKTLEAYNNFVFEENRDHFLPYIQALQD